MLIPWYEIYKHEVHNPYGFMFFKLIMFSLNITKIIKYISCRYEDGYIKGLQLK